MKLRSLLLGLLAAAAAFSSMPAGAGQPRERDVHLFTWNVGTMNPLAFRLPESSVPRVIDTIAGVDADLVTLQEVCSCGQAAQIVSGLLLRGKAYTYASVVVDKRRADGRLAVTLYRGRAELIEHCTSNGYGVLAVRQRGVTVVNVHAPITTPDRETFFPEVAAWARTLPGPVVVIGDFNLGPKGGAGPSVLSPWARKRDRHTFADFTAALPVGTTPEQTNAFGLSIDHARTFEGEVLRQEVHHGRRIFPMDHDPLEVELRLPLGAPTQSIVDQLAAR